jgi:hypothetical protein
VSFFKIKKSISNFIWKHNGPPKSKKSWLKKSYAQSIIISDFKLYYGVIVKEKTAWYWHKNRNKDQWISIDDPEINLHCCTHLIFDKDTKSIHWRRHSLQQMILEKLDIHMQKTKNTDISLILYKNQFKMNQRA